MNEHRLVVEELIEDWLRAKTTRKCNVEFVIDLHGKYNYCVILREEDRTAICYLAQLGDDSPTEWHERIQTGGAVTFQYAIDPNTISVGIILSNQDQEKVRFIKLLEYAVARWDSYFWEVPTNGG